MADGDGYKRQPNRYEERPCPKCGDLRMVRKDQPKTKQCRSCSKKNKKQIVKNPSPKHDPQKQGAWASYWQAKRRCSGKGAHPEYYEHVEFRFADFNEWWAELGKRPEGHTCDRIDPWGHYEPGNVRWATQSQQNHNKRFRRWAKRPQ